MHTAPCREIRGQLIEVVRCGSLAKGLEAHLAQCAGCNRFFAGQKRLSGAFAALAEQFAPQGPPLRIEAALLAELDRRKVPARRYGYRIAVGSAVAAALMAAVWLQSPREKIVAIPAPPPAISNESAALESATMAIEAPPKPMRPRHSAPTPQAAGADAVTDVNSSPFIELPWTVPLAPDESASVVRMNLAVSALVAAGLSVDADPAGAAAADVLVGVDGRARAVRLVSISDNLNANRRMQ